MIDGLFTLERTLPNGVLAGLMSGEYSLHGGVVRNAAGQIVRHLVPASTSALDPFGFLAVVPSLYNTYQLSNLTQMTAQVLAISSATMAMSGLNLAVSVVGFSALQAGLNRIENHLVSIGKQLNWIKAFLDAGRRARFLNAIDQLSSLPRNERDSYQILHSCHITLGEVAMHYLQHWDESTDLWESMSYQHYYCTAFLAQARCSAELEMYDVASKEFRRGLDNWQRRSRDIAIKAILADDRSRFLGKEYLDLAPTAKIAGWMDFAYGERRGFTWIDELRREFSPPSALYDWEWPGVADKKKKTRNDQVSFLDNLSSRNHVLEGYESQFRFLEDKRIRPSVLEAEMRRLTREHEGEGIVIIACDPVTPKKIHQSSDSAGRGTSPKLLAKVGANTAS